MDPSTETKIWKPQEAETLDGKVHSVGSLRYAVQTEDGSVWLLEADAENQLEALEPEEGQPVRVSFKHESWHRSDYTVSLP
jgi:hypothetical protein